MKLAYVGSDNKCLLLNGNCHGDVPSCSEHKQYMLLLAQELQPSFLVSFSLLNFSPLLLIKYRDAKAKQISPSVVFVLLIRNNNTMYSSFAKMQILSQVSQKADFELIICPPTYCTYLSTKWLKKLEYCAVSVSY